MAFLTVTVNYEYVHVKEGMQLDYADHPMFLHFRAMLHAHVMRQLEVRLHAARSLTPLIGVWGVSGLVGFVLAASSWFNVVATAAAGVLVVASVWLRWSARRKIRRFSSYRLDEAADQLCAVYEAVNIVAALEEVPKRAWRM